MNEVRQQMVVAIIKMEIDVANVEDPDREHEPGAMSHISAAASLLLDENPDIDAILGLLHNAQLALVEESMGI